jgi:hypothetical protein
MGESITRCALLIVISQRPGIQWAPDFGMHALHGDHRVFPMMHAADTPASVVMKEALTTRKA